MAPRGYIDGVIGGEIVGWVIDEDRSGARLEVSGSLDGIAPVPVIAGQARGDLRSAGLGDGAHGFRIPFASARLTPGPHLVEVRVLETGECLPLANDWVVHGKDDAPIAGVLLRTAGGPAPPSDEAAAAQERAPAQPRPGGPEVALVGAANWLFAVPAVGLDARCGRARVSHAALDGDVAAVEAFFELAGRVGAAACCAELPDKLQVYAEHLPAGLSVDEDGRWARRLAARLRDSDSAKVLDLFDPLTDARIHGRVFARTGRSLTWVGAFHAYRAIARELATVRPQMAPRPIADVDLGPLAPVPDSLAGGPLAAWLDGDVVGIEGLARPIPSDEEPTLQPRGPHPAAGRKNRPAGVVVHDGSGERVASLLCEHFSSSTVLVADRVTREAVTKANPDVIVWVRGDR